MTRRGLALTGVTALTALLIASTAGVVLGTRGGQALAVRAQRRAHELTAGPAGTTSAAQAEGLAAAPTTVPVEGDPAWAWRPDGPLPAPSTSSSILVVFSPHPDDETLSMGALIVKAHREGMRCYVVAMTDGWSSAAFDAVARRWTMWNQDSGTDRRPLTRTMLGQARVNEMHAAVARLGVAPGDVIAAHLDAPTSDRGARTTVAEATAVMTAFARLFPHATFATMSFTAERQPDHLDDGVALRRLVRSGTRVHAVWAVSRLWWRLPVPAWAWVRPVDSSERAQVVAAALDYTVFDPPRLRLAVGQASVSGQFCSLRRDPVSRLHID